VVLLLSSVLMNGNGAEVYAAAVATAAGSTSISQHSEQMFLIVDNEAHYQVSD
jgi:hypothetical protein